MTKSSTYATFTRLKKTTNWSRCVTRWLLNLRNKYDGHSQADPGVTDNWHSYLLRMISHNVTQISKNDPNIVVSSPYIIQACRPGNIYNSRIPNNMQCYKMVVQVEKELFSKSQPLLNASPQASFRSFFTHSRDDHCPCFDHRA